MADKLKIDSVTSSVTFSQYAYITVSLPLGSLFFCFITAIIFRYDEVNETVCNVQNFVPSISAITGIFPQAYIWRMCIALHATPRLLSCLMYYNMYKDRLRNITQQRLRLYSSLVRLNFWLHITENICLASVSFISNRENYPVHEKIFIVFMVSSLCYMLLNTYLFKWSSLGLHSDLERTSYKYKLLFLVIALTSTAALLITFYLHRVKCVPLAFSFFSIAEYIIAIANMCYHMTAVYEFYDRVMCVGSIRDEYMNGDVVALHTTNKSD